ncbi:MAG: DUF2235 domain-containing protein, partial [Burkholderiaceae bacterium]|nr:DUF2235 domain-containing protein [Burkholderiaceae bacterium]
MSTFKTVLQPAAVRCPKALAHSRPGECEFILNIGIFFDGTDNNQRQKREIDNPGLNTNVVRLSDAYRDIPAEGYFRYYVSGVGTPFYELGKTQAEAFGAPFGAGGEARILYGLLQIINSVHRFINNQKPRFEDPALAALCSTTRVPSTPEQKQQSSMTDEQKILDALGLRSGLVDAGDRHFFIWKNDGERGKFFAKISDELAEQVRAKKMPKVVAIYIDVFGFSRGAAQARVFTSWLHQFMLKDGQLFGVPSYVRMLGLFDTVASVGPTNALGSAGHNAWATAADLQIHSAVKNCVHYVALHELRTNFPLDSAAVGEDLLPEVHEHYCPGAHSDVGGGYAAGEQGKGIDWISKRAEAQHQLSMLPLNEMYRAALQSGLGHENRPWIEMDSRDAEALKLPERFGRDQLESIRNDVAAYFQTAGVPADPSPGPESALRQHGLRYLAWRLNVMRGRGFEMLPSVSDAQRLDHDGYDFYRQGEKIFEKQIGWLEHKPIQTDPVHQTGAYAGNNSFHSHAGQIYGQMKEMSEQITPDQGKFFDGWVHDSYAGFIAKFHEKEENWVSSVFGD